MKRRRIRIGQIIVIAASLAFAIFGVWYRAYISRDGILSQGGVLGLVSYLLGQLLLNAENEVAIEVLNYRHDRTDDGLRRIADAVGISIDEAFRDGADDTPGWEA